MNRTKCHCISPPVYVRSVIVTQFLANIFLAYAHFVVKERNVAVFLAVFLSFCERVETVTLTRPSWRQWITLTDFITASFAMHLKTMTNYVDLIYDYFLFLSISPLREKHTHFYFVCSQTTQKRLKSIVRDNNNKSDTHQKHLAIDSNTVIATA